MEVWSKEGEGEMEPSETTMHVPQAASGADSGDNHHIGWSLMRRATPGNLDGLDELFGVEVASSSYSSSVCIKISSDSSHTQRMVGLAFIDQSSHAIRLCELVDDANFSVLEQALMQQAPREAFIIGSRQGMLGGVADAIKVRTLLSAYRIPLQRTRGKMKIAGPAIEEGEDGEQDARLQSIVSGSGINVTSTELHELSKLISASSPLPLTTPHLLQTKHHALSALHFLIRALALSSSSSMMNDDASYQLHELELSSFLRLDAAAHQALTLFPRADDADRNMSLYGLLNQCRTAMGARLLATWIRQPLTHCDRIIARQDYVELFMRHAEMREELRQSILGHIPDLQKMVTRLQKKTATLEEVMSIYSTAAIKLPRLRDTFEQFCTNHPTYKPSSEQQQHNGNQMSDMDADSPLARPFLQRLQFDFITPLQSHLSSLAPFISMCEHAIQVEQQQSHGLSRIAYSINPAIHPTLQQIAMDRLQAKSVLDEEVATIQQQVHKASKGSIQPKLAYSDQRNTGYHLRLTKTEERKWNGGKGMGIGAEEGQVKKLESRRDGLHFTTRRLEKLAQSVQALENEFRQASEQLLVDVITTTATYTPVLESLCQLVSTLDVFMSLAFVASQSPIPWTRPTMLPMGSGIIEMKSARHACMEVVRASASSTFIPNDVLMEKGQSHLQIITGPNMGGKSSYCRTAGLCLLMAQMGCYIPASSARLTVVDSIMSRIGAGDQSQRGQSTFMVEMQEAAVILKLATSNSFVIIDELGRGTSVDDGCGLAYAIAAYLAKEIQCFTFFATHFQEVTELEHEQKGVVNKHVCVSATGDSLTMLYELADGAADRSYGIHVAQIARFPKEIIEDATRKAEKLERFTWKQEKGADEDEREEKSLRMDEPEPTDDDEDDHKLLTLFSQHSGPETKWSQLDDETLMQQFTAFKQKLTTMQTDSQTEHPVSMDMI